MYLYCNFLYINNILHAQILPRVYNSIESESYKRYPTSSLYMFLSMELVWLLEHCKQSDILTTLACLLNIFDEHYFDL